MDPESAYWTLSTIAQATAALVGLVTIAAVFFMDRFVELIRGLRPLTRIPIIFGRAMRITVRYAPVGMLILGLAYPMYSGLNVVVHSVETMKGIPSGATALNDSLYANVQSVVHEFRSSMITIGAFIPSWIVFGYLIVLLLERMVDNRQGYQRIEDAAKQLVLDKATNFIAAKRKEAETYALTDEDILDEYDRGVESPFFAPLNSEIRRIVSGRFPRIRVTDGDIRRFVFIALEDLTTEWPQPSP